MRQARGQQRDDLPPGQRQRAQQICFPDELCDYLGASFPLGPVGNTKWTQVAAAEILFTFVLCYVVLSMAVFTKTSAPQFFGLAIGSCVTVGGFAIGGISGGSLNPAVSAGIAAASAAVGGARTPASCLAAVRQISRGS